MSSIWIDGSYVAPLRVMSEGIRARTHLAQIQIGARLATAYVKAFEPESGRGLFNEVAGGLIARHAGIGAPPGGMVWVPLTVLQSLFSGARFAHHHGMVPCYASAPVDNGYGLAAIGLAARPARCWTQLAGTCWPGPVSLLAWPSTNGWPTSTDMPTTCC